MTPANLSPTAHELEASWDALTAEELRRRGSLKWTVEPGVIGAWVAEMDLGTAPAVTAVLEHAVRDSAFGYTSPVLNQALREATARYQREVHDWRVEAEDVLALPDVLSALRAIIARHTPEGSAVIVPTPAYMPFLRIPGELDRELIAVPARRTRVSADAAAGWALDLDAIEAAMAAGAGLLVLCHPWNPVGRVLTHEELDAVAALSTRYGVSVFSDEIHGPLVLDPTLAHTPYASRPGTDPDLTFTATAASKGWNIPGLKCAQLVVSGEARRSWESSALSRNLSNQGAGIGAMATIAAYDEGREWIEAVRRYVRATAGEVEQVLSAAGVGVTRPEGTYLAWLDLSGTAAAASPARFLLERARVAVNDGVTFGRGFESFARLNLAAPRPLALETASRIAQALA
ncbi:MULTISPECIES: MalY/PatB family protein [Actinomyces]|uniref:MalY/PatB family protein n=1 Tax=Actinomyces TaxID=1654 RepID=UPI001FBBD4C3|nr:MULTISPECIES: aminotransferase class I/II-fold pyridoxal phosphate-dependent enzyme [Actinomyces]